MGASIGKEHSYTSGYHILRIEKDSPAIKAGIEPFFDFIVAFDGVELTNFYDHFLRMLQEKEGRPALVTVYNSRTDNIRTVEVTPNRNWGGKGLLGLNIRFCSFSTANDIILHILDVLPNSPAKLSGLVPYSDYIVGYDHISENVDFFDLVKESIGKPVNLYVYNSNTKKCRDVIVVPSQTWGGQSLLGCDIGTGYLHRIPKEEIQEILPKAVPQATPRSPQIELSSVPIPEPLHTLMQPSSEPEKVPEFPEPISSLIQPIVRTEPTLNIEDLTLPPVTFFYSMPEGGYNFYNPSVSTSTAMSDLPPPSDLPVIDNIPHL